MQNLKPYIPGSFLLKILSTAKNSFVVSTFLTAFKRCSFGKLGERKEMKSICLFRVSMMDENRREDESMHKHMAEQTKS